jgi:hypothetical protein
VKTHLYLFTFFTLIISACAATPTSPPPLPTTSFVTPAPAIPATPKPTLAPDDPPPANAQREFKTDFSKHSVPYGEIFSGGPPKDGIPALSNPKFVTVKEANDWLKPVEPIILFEINGDARAYPIQILMWHEIVNDAVGGVPVIITFCPLCNTAIAFERAVKGQMLDFGTTGRLRYSNLVMYDRQTETWWQQGTGEAIAGELTGTKLIFRAVSIIAWDQFKATYPNGKVLSKDTGYGRAYGSNPYAGYDDVNSSPFLYRGPKTPDVLPAVAYVLTVDLNGKAAAYPYETLKQVNVVNDSVGGKEIVVMWAAGTAASLNAATVAGGRDLGSANAFARELDGQTLTFVFQNGRLMDKETGSEWNILGQAANGKLKGKSLAPVIAINHFWFSWAAFKPDTRVYKP